MRQPIIPALAVLCICVVAARAVPATAPTTRPTKTLVEAVADLTEARKAESRARETAPQRVANLPAVNEARSVLAAAEKSLAEATSNSTRQQKIEAKDRIVAARKSLDDTIALSIERDSQVTIAVAAVKQAEAAVESLQWVDVLDAVDPRAHALKGEWTFEGNTLVVNRRMPVERAALKLPIRAGESYKLRVRFSRDGAVGGPFIIFPVGQSLAMFEFDAHSPRCSGIGRILGQYPDHNETRVPGVTLRSGTTCEMVLDVREENALFVINVTLDGKPFVQWSGAQQSISAPEFFDLPERVCQFFSREG